MIYDPDEKNMRHFPPDGLMGGKAVARVPSALLQFFESGHLPSHLQLVVHPFAALAQVLDETLPANPEKTVALRKLLEAKDCAVRAVLFRAPTS